MVSHSNIVQSYINAVALAEELGLEIKVRPMQQFEVGGVPVGDDISAVSGFLKGVMYGLHKVS